jgi:hypothetical protein
VPVLAVTLNLTGVAPQDVDRVVADCRAQIPGIPVIDVVRDGLDTLADIVANPALRQSS